MELVTLQSVHEALEHMRLNSGPDAMQEALAMLVAHEAQEPSLSVPDECPHIIVFDDTDRAPIYFAGAGARKAALLTFEKVSISWNAHLFVRIARNSRDDIFPCASHQ